MAAAPLIAMMISYLDGVQESKEARLARLLPILICPRCSGGLISRSSNFICRSCEVVYPLRSCVPILLPSGVNDASATIISEEDLVSRHPYSTSAMEIIAAHADGLVLDLGAGGKFDRYWNVVQVDIFRYPAVDVVASADRLPFADNSFDAVVSQAVFEHLQYPEWAAAEIRRVLKVGGIAKVDTAFLQPEHGYPYHFFNATETGLRHWFRDFDIKWSGVEPFQQPKWALHWFLGVYLDYVAPEHANVLRNLSVGNLVRLLQRHADGATSESDAPVIAALDAIPERFVRVLAAGVSVKAINRPKEPFASAFHVTASPASVDREREMELLRSEKLEMQIRHDELLTRFNTLRDQADYLQQFAPSADRKTVNLTDVLGPKGAYLDLVANGPHFRGCSDRPFASIITAPTDVSRLLDTFFSLTSQTYSGWELVILLSKSATPMLGGLVLRLAKLESRLRVVYAEGTFLAMTHCEGEFSFTLTDGATLVPHALEEIVTAAKFTPGLKGVSFDYERQSGHGPHTVRCHSQVPWTHMDTTACFVKIEDAVADLDVAVNVAHIALPLMRLAAESDGPATSLRAKLRYLTEQNLESCKLISEACNERDSLASEWRQLTDDTANYLSQFSPESASIDDISFRTWARRSTVRILRNKLPANWWQLLQKFKSSREASQAVQQVKCQGIPFATFVLEPSSLTGLIQTFFSLTHQTYSAWQLILVETHHQSPAIRRAVFDFMRLDQRIRVVNGANPATRTNDVEGAATGQFLMQLTDGVSLRFQCLEQVVALVRKNPLVSKVACDYEYARPTMQISMRCYNQRVQESECKNVGFDGVFVSRSALGHQAKDCESVTAYIPTPLLFVNRWNL